ncbi:hypothetical protein HDU97_004278 [Phlyctochytrium planicorne]|nr:hypothetical protein HDU97_004278 [Phlyctochytrium planicorne]
MGSTIKSIAAGVVILALAHSNSAAAIDRRGVDEFLFEAPPGGSNFNEYGKSFTFITKLGSAAVIPPKGGFKVSTDQIPNSWDVLTSMLPFPNHCSDLNRHFAEAPFQTMQVLKGSQIRERSEVCANLPVQYDTKYRTAYLPKDAIADLKAFTISSFPFYRQPKGDAFGVDIDSMFGMCMAFNKDAMMFAVNPSFPSGAIPGMKFASAAEPLSISVSGFGLSWKAKGLNYTAPNMNVWTGSNGLTPPQASFAANVWANFGLEAALPEICPICKLSAQVSVFTSSMPSAKQYTAGINVGDITFDLELLPLLSFGKGFGVWRNDETNNVKGGDDICNPSGLYFQVKQELTIPLADSILTKFLGFDSSTGKQPVDAYFAFRAVDGLNGAGLRFVKTVKLLNFDLGKVEVEFQYLSSREFDRRRKYFGKSNPCKIRCTGYDKNGLCIDDASGIRKVDRFLLGEAVTPGDYVLLTADYKNKMSFLGSIMLTIDRATFFLGDFYIYGRLRVLFIESDIYITSTSNELTFQATTDIELLSWTVKGRADISKSFHSTAVGRPLDKTSWSISVSAQLSTFLKNAEKFVTTEVHNFAKFCSQTWGKVKNKIKSIANDIEGLFVGKNAPLGFLATEFRSVARDATDLVNGIKDFGGKFEQFGKSEVKALADCGENIIKGNPKDALKALGKVFTNAGDALKDGFSAAFGKSSSSKEENASGKDKYGCGMKRIKTKTCTKVLGIKTNCRTKHGEAYSDPECLKTIVKAAASVRAKSSEASTLSKKLEQSKAKLPAVAVIAKDVEAGKPFILPPGTIDPLNLNLDTSDPNAANIVNNYSPTVRGTARKLSSTGAGQLGPAESFTHKIAPFQLQGPDVTPEYLKRHFVAQQVVFNNKLKNFVMNGQNDLDSDIIKAAA